MYFVIKNFNSELMLIKVREMRIWKEISEVIRREQLFFEIENGFYYIGKGVMRGENKREELILEVIVQQELLFILGLFAGKLVGFFKVMLECM